MFVVAPSTVVDTRRLRLARVGAQMLGRGLRVIPRRPLFRRVFWRIVFDQAPLRYIMALSPFPIAMLIRPDLALAISQAPLLMFAIVFMVESTLLSVSTPEKRRKLISEADAARGLDLLNLRARDVLARIAARRGMESENLHLVVEQSGLARVPVLTLASVQVAQEGGRPILLDVDDAERAMLEERLFAEGLDEPLLHRINLAQNRFVRSVAFEARAVSAHQRLMARAGRRGAAGA
ncbi:MAG: hypothetical protein V2I65_14010 [Paracoccaceae bacterium]|jgi:hypothetical protein|nr:hypothetical protein [Paracoccaceae bacterium]